MLIRHASCCLVDIPCRRANADTATYDDAILWPGDRCACHLRFVVAPTIRTSLLIGRVAPAECADFAMRSAGAITARRAAPIFLPPSPRSYRHHAAIKRTLDNALKSCCKAVPFYAFPPLQQIADAMTYLLAPLYAYMLGP